MITKKIQEFKLKSFKKKSGKLIPIEFKKKFRMTAKRIFYIYGNKDMESPRCSEPAIFIVYTIVKLFLLLKSSSESC